MKSDKKIDVLLLGDVVGSPGRKAIEGYLGCIRENGEFPDLVVANVENAAHGFGLTEKILLELQECGVNVFSGGNHTFDKKDIFDFIDKYPTLLRPANYPPDTPGKGFCIVEVDGARIGFLNLIGRVFMEPMQSPFLIADQMIEELKDITDSIIVDFHAEATAEKVAMGWYLDGRVSAVVGTHTHVQTADDRLLHEGTAYITDLGFCGSCDGVIGMDKKGVFKRLIEQLPSRFEIASGPIMVNGVMISISLENGKAVSIKRVSRKCADGLWETD